MPFHAMNTVKKLNESPPTVTDHAYYWFLTLSQADFDQLIEEEDAKDILSETDSMDQCDVTTDMDELQPLDPFLPSFQDLSEETLRAIYDAWRAEETQDANGDLMDEAVELLLYEDDQAQAN